MKQAVDGQDKLFSQQPKNVPSENPATTIRVRTGQHDPQLLGKAREAFNERVALQRLGQIIVLGQLLLTKVGRLEQLLPGEKRQAETLVATPRRAA